MWHISTKNLRAKTSKIANRASNSTIDVASGSTAKGSPSREPTSALNANGNGPVGEHSLQALYSPISSVGSAEQEALAACDLPISPVEYKWLGLISTATDADANPKASYTYEQELRGPRNLYGAEQGERGAEFINEDNHQVQLMIDWWRVHPPFEFVQRSQVLLKIAEVDNIGDEIVTNLLMFSDHLNEDVKKKNGHVYTRFNCKLKSLVEDFERNKCALQDERETELKSVQDAANEKLQQKRNHLGNDIYNYRFPNVNTKTRKPTRTRTTSKKQRQKQLAKKVFDTDGIDADILQLRKGIADYDAMKLCMMLSKLNSDKPLKFP